MRKLTIRAFMTPAPHTIGVEQTIAAAAEMMREHHIRHLPVLDGGRLVGILSERDVAMIGGLPGVNVERLAVAEAMTPDPRALTPDSSLEWVAAEMAQHKFGSMVVVENDRVVGIFTTVDALRALQELLSRSRRRGVRRA
jgi:acetoin utilization protein AcuB